MKASGFSLLESLLVMVLISFALLALFAAQRTMAEHNNLLRQRNEALQLAENKLEALRNMSAETQANGNFSQNITSTSAQYLIKWQIQACLPANLACKSVNITAEWQDPMGKPQSLSLSSRLGQHNLVSEYRIIRGS